MSLRICTAEYMLSTVDGLDFARHWFPRIVAEAFLESTKDGEIKLSPDPVTMIDGDMTWFNNTDDPQWVMVQVERAPRSIVTQSPTTLVIHDAWSHDAGVSPLADYPSVVQDTFGGRAQIDRSVATADALLYGRLFYDGDSTQAWETVGIVPPQQSMHFRYIAAVQTPGLWITPTEFEPRWEAQARWTRLLAFATPVGTR